MKMRDFDRESRIFNRIFWAIFSLVFLSTIGIFGFYGYMAVRFGPKVLDAADKGLDVTNKALDKADNLLSE